MYEEEIPNEWFCPITQELLIDPVIAADGYTYERKSLESWFKKSHMSPVTGLVLNETKVIPNYAIKHTIEQYLEKQKKSGLPIPSKKINYNPQNVHCEFDCLVNDGSYYLDCKLVPPKKPEGKRPPCSIFCILDISQSMSLDAMIGGKDVQSHGFSRLDLVKHSITTMTEFMDQNDEICLIPFNNSAKVALPLIKTNKTGKRIVSETLKKLEPSGTTNIWDGLKVSLDLVKPLLSKHQNTSIVLLTDGQPNLNPPRGIIPTLKKYLMILQMPTPNIHVFGYGYELDTKLLMEIASIGNGTYTYIPDCSMVGTAFVNFMASALACYSNKLQIKFSFSEGIEAPQIVGYGEIQNNAYHMGAIQYGQSRNLILKFKERVAMGGNSTLGKIQIGQKVQDIPVHHIPESEEHMRNILLRIKYLTLLRKLSFHKVDLKEAYEEVENFYQFVKKAEENELVKALLKELKNQTSENEGQVSKAFQKEEWYSKWGQHYIPSLFLAHLMQTCTNFKDPALQLYGGQVFEENRNKMDTLFIKMPPPQPTAKKQKNIVYKPAPVDMYDYYDEYGGCINEGCMVLMYDGSIKPIEKLRKGDLVKTKNGESAEVVCLVKSKVFQEVNMVRMGKLLITPWHPVKVQGKWQFPASLHRKQKTFIQCYYNYVLKGAESLICQGVECISLGHGIQKDEVASHIYLGSNKVVEDLKNSKDWETGKLKVSEFVRDQQTHLIKRIMIEN